MTSIFNLGKLLSGSNFVQDERQMLLNDNMTKVSVYNDSDDLSALKIQNPDAKTFRVLSKKEEKERNKTRHRLLGKDGVTGTTTKNKMWMKTRRKLFYDLFTTMIDNSWPVLISIIFIIYFLVWFLFAGVWYTVALLVDDLTEEGKMKKEYGKIFWRRHYP